MRLLLVEDDAMIERAIRRAGVPEATTGFPRLRPVTREDSGMRIGHLVDPDGTQLSLVEDAE